MNDTNADLLSIIYPGIHYHKSLMTQSAELCYHSQVQCNSAYISTTVKVEHVQHRSYFELTKYTLYLASWVSKQYGSGHQVVAVQQGST